MKRVTMYIPHLVFDMLEKVAKTKQLPYSQIIRGAIWEQLKKEGLIGQESQYSLLVLAKCYVNK